MRRRTTVRSRYRPLVVLPASWNLRWQDLLAEVGLLTLAVVLPLTFGGRQPEVDVVAAFVAVAAAAGLLAARRAFSVPWYGWLLLAVSAYTTLQLLPLPLSVLRWLAPASASTLEVSLAAVGGLPAWHPISLDPVATVWELMKLLVCALAFLIAHNHLREPARRERFVYAMFFGGMVTVLVGFVGALGQGGQSNAGGLIRTTFYNGNHGAAYLLLCATLAAALVARRLGTERRVLIALGAAWVGTGVFMTLSRGGIISLGLALAAVTALLGWYRAEKSGRAPLLVLGAVALLAIFGGLVAYDALLREFRPALVERDWGKIALWPAGWAMVRDNAWVGVGRGAFLSTFPRYLTDSAWAGQWTTYAYLENQYLHLPAEWGLPAALALLTGSICALAHWLRRGPRDVLTAGAGAALIGLAAHNVLDYNLELITLGLPAAVLAGFLSAGVASRASEEPPPADRLSRVLAGALVLLVLALAIFGALRPLRDSEGDLRAALPRLEAAQGSAALSGARQAVAAAIRRHPADYYPHWVMGRLALHSGVPEALEWLDRAAYLNPPSPEVHRDAGRALAQFGRRRQALIEYRAALSQQALAAALLSEALPLCRRPEDLTFLLPEQPDLHARAIMWLVANKGVALAVAHVKWARRRWPGHPGLLRAAVRVALAAQRPRDALADARTLVGRLAEPESFELLAASATAAGEYALAVDTLRRACHRFPAQRKLVFGLIEAHLSAGQTSEAKQLAERLVEQTGDAAERARAFVLLARVHQRAGRPHEARWAREQARRLNALPR